MKKMKLSKIISLIMALLITAILMAFSFGCSDGDGIKKPGGDGTKPSLPTTEYEEDELLPPAPVDEGELVDHIFEAEYAFDGVSTKGSTVFDKKCVAQSLFFDTSFSGNTIVRNMSNVKNKYLFEFDSDSTYQVTMVVAVASAYESNAWVEKPLSYMYGISVNGKGIKEYPIVPAGNEEQMRGGNYYTCIQYVEVPIEIKEGENVIILSCLSKASNLDYINIKTSAELTNIEPRYWDDDTVTTIALPTATDDGKMTLTCAEHSITSEFTLPALNEDGGYTVSEDKQTYSFEFNGETYSMKTDGTYEFPEDVVVPVISDTTINGKEFFEPANWTTFGKGTLTGSIPTLSENVLSFNDASRFEFFYVKNGVHIGDLASNLKDKSFYNQPYTWTVNISSNAKFSMILFANNNFKANLDEALADDKSGAGAYLVFEDGTLSVYHMQYGVNQKVATAGIGSMLDGNAHEFGITAVRTSDEELKFSLAIDGTTVALTAESDLQSTQVTENEIVLLSTKMFGQRLCIVPEEGTTVNISALELP